MAEMLSSQNEFENVFSSLVYRGEGNANLVMAHITGDIVIRFHKHSTKEDLPDDGGRSRVIAEINFSNQVLKQLLGPYIHVPEMVFYDLKMLDKLILSIQHLRPSQRLSKSILEPFATQLPDYTLSSKSLFADEEYGSSVFCVEIKPKQGYICEIDKKYPKCLFCLKQYLKIKGTPSLEMSDYCPFDLFSGNKDRMRRALSNLMKNPQNNFKIFKNGTCCYDQDSSQNDLQASVNELFNCSQKQSFESLLIKILLHPFHKDNYLLIKNSLSTDVKISDDLDVQPRIETSLTNQLIDLLSETRKSCDFDCNTLPQGCILERILQMQKLHQHGDDVVYAIYKKHYDICDKLIHANVIETFKNAKTVKENTSDNFRNEEEQLQNSPNDDNFARMKILKNELKILQNYLLFSTARDCSIMICFRKIASNAKSLDTATVIKLSEDDKFIVSVNISDSDLKSLQCINRHYERDFSLMTEIVSQLSQKIH